MEKPRILLSLCFLVLALLLGCAGAVLWRGHSQQVTLLRTAERLGYDPSTKIAQVKRCWDIFSHCGQQLFYETNLTQVEFASNLDGLTWDVTNQMTVDGYEIFTKLNLGTASRITVSGVDGLGDRSQLPPFKGYRWRLTDPDGRSWAVDYYPLADQAGPFAINGRALKRNIVQVLYQTR
ncbi:MAG: hypothetical protein ISS48_01485 [Candidatus Aenigmarchaeota archaeon]|nr:hypothetical protein [Candidatus Aenigmarchaeota archaeon]